jgi:hypothetical protein
MKHIFRSIHNGIAILNKQRFQLEEKIHYQNQSFSYFINDIQQNTQKFRSGFVRIIRIVMLSCVVSICWKKYQSDQLKAEFQKNNVDEKKK